MDRITDIEAELDVLALNIEHRDFDPAISRATCWRSSRNRSAHRRSFAGCMPKSSGTAPTRDATGNLQTSARAFAA
jgi:hypothetical protein